MAEQNNDPIEYTFTAEELKEVDTHVAKYPQKISAVMPVLWIAQRKYGWLSQGAMQLVAGTLELSYAHVYGVASFYTQYFKRAAPKYVLDMCTCFACGEIGGQKAYETAKSYLNCDKEGMSEDGLFWVRHAECLGACDTGPITQVTNGHYRHHCDAETVKTLIEDLRKGNEMTFHSIALSDQSAI